MDDALPSKDTTPVWRVVPYQTATPSELIVNVREVLPRDRSVIEAGYAQLSDRSRRLRYLSAHQFLSDAELDDIVTNDGYHRMALGAEIKNVDSAPSPVGVARYVRNLEQPDEAEFAITTADEFHGLGIGMLLLGSLAKQAAFVGIDRFTALVSPDNGAMLHILQNLGGTQEGASEDNICVTLPLTRSSRSYPDNPTGRRWKKAFGLTRLVQVDGTSD
ncbi:hypothetical protein [Ahrensia sp. R2A130]|uniref:hypothetical protein n=1 Tax=Ahrensia sp. R2A130 TaxID=744979 RepID=UPI0001E0D838|nr:hypothetical protein [Ahrensia sp. R2A130]EFL89801.1 acetyltransferase [Ahrensia sp. R2A130]